jgi:hypothetical protein
MKSTKLSFSGEFASWRWSSRRRTSEVTRTKAAGWTESPRAAVPHLSELLFLFIVEDLIQPRIHFFLQIVELRALVRTELEKLLKHSRQDLSWTRRAEHEAAWPSARRWTESGWSPRSKAGRTVTVIGVLFLGKRCELGLRDFPILVGIGSIEQPVQSMVTHFLLGEDSVPVLVKLHHAGNEIRGVS